MQNINEFPPEVLEHILNYVYNRKTIILLSTVCKLWNEILQNSSSQKHLASLRELYKKKSSGIYSSDIIYDVATLYGNMLKNNLYKLLEQLSPNNTIYQYYVNKQIDVNADKHIKVNITKKNATSLARVVEVRRKNIINIKIISNGFITIFDNNGKIITENNLLGDRVTSTRFPIHYADYAELHAILFHFYKNS
jgi:hypothetical protein